eukprot:TRINITY_DN6089_c0_g2_i2.p1 TRINITY_DN6089_c0_g2~~TRINITY_DN6089_c0_g2_i2.p1  ORF type:complete len:391 (-),score=93.38 TRINITY_DN6089_c0_g2_i2:11-1183(-)
MVNDDGTMLLHFKLPFGQTELHLADHDKSKYYTIMDDVWVNSPDGPKNVISWRKDGKKIESDAIRTSMNIVCLDHRHQRAIIRSTADPSRLCWFDLKSKTVLKQIHGSINPQWGTSYLWDRWLFYFDDDMYHMWDLDAMVTSWSIKSEQFDCCAIFGDRVARLHENEGYIHSVYDGRILTCLDMKHWQHGYPTRICMDGYKLVASFVEELDPYSIGIFDILTGHVIWESQRSLTITALARDSDIFDRIYIQQESGVFYLDFSTRWRPKETISFILKISDDWENITCRSQDIWSVMCTAIGDAFTCSLIFSSDGTNIYEFYIPAFDSPWPFSVDFFPFSSSQTRPIAVHQNKKIFVKIRLQENGNWKFQDLELSEFQIEPSGNINFNFNPT